MSGIALASSTHFLQKLFKQAISAQASGETSYAEHLYHQILELQPLDANAMHALGLLAAQQQQWENAVYWFQKTLMVVPNSIQLHLHLGNVFKNMGQLTLAASHYRKALSYNPEYAEAHNNLAGLFYKQNKLNQAQNHYEEAIRIRPNYLEARFNLGLLFLAQTEKEKAIDQFKCLVLLDPPLAQAHWQLALIYWKDNDLRKAKHHYQVLLKLTPNSPTLLNNIGALWLKKQQPEKAINYFKQALSIQPNHKEALINCATALLQKNHFKEAILHYSHYLRLEPLDKEALFNRAHAFRLVGGLEEAFYDLKKILSLDKTHVNAHCNLASLYLKLNNKTAAVHHYQIILSLKKDHSIASYMKSVLNQQEGHLKAPIDYIKHLFNDYALHFETHLLDTLSYKTPQLLRKELTPFLKTKQYTILDLGCGTGLSGVPFLDIKKNLIGVDISTNMLKKAKEKRGYDLLIEKDIEGYLNELGPRFDLIVCIDTLVYFGQLDDLFSKIKAHLYPNGLFAFSIELAKKTVLSYALQTTGRYQHASSYIEKLAKENTFKLLRFTSVEGRYQAIRPVKTGLFLFQLL